MELSQSAGNSRGASRCPMPVINDNQQAPIYLLGYPLDLDLSISSGLISSQTSPNGRRQTDTIMNVGNSGGPAFNEFGVAASSSGTRRRFPVSTSSFQRP